MLLLALRKSIAVFFATPASLLGVKLVKRTPCPRALSHPGGDGEHIILNDGLLDGSAHVGGDIGIQAQHAGEITAHHRLDHGQVDRPDQFRKETLVQCGRAERNRQMFDEG